MGRECGKRSDVWEKESLCSRIRPKKEIIEGQPVATNLVPKGTRNTIACYYGAEAFELAQNSTKTARLTSGPDQLTTAGGD